MQSHSFSSLDQALKPLNRQLMESMSRQHAAGRPLGEEWTAKLILGLVEAKEGDYNDEALGELSLRRKFKKLWAEGKHATAFMALLVETTNSFRQHGLAQRLENVAWYLAKAERKRRQQLKQAQGHYYRM